MPLAPGTVVDRYTVDTLLGQGGMGTVYRVRHNQLGSLHALKVLHAGGAHLTERLVQEGRLQGGLRHPGLVRVTDLIEVGDDPALVLEYVDGCSLEELLHTEGRLDAERADWLARRILEAVAAAHRHGLIHRDLKPGNILLAEVDGTLQPKVADFGLAKALDSRGPTATGSAMGTPAYMAPEQFKDASSVDERADVFSLGAVLYELVTGRRAFEGDTLQEVMWKTVNGDFAPLPELPPAWTAAIEGALHPDPEQRIPTVDALLAAWGHETKAPAFRLPTLTPSLYDAPTGLHPDVEDLVHRADEPVIADHLASCAACRVERRLFLDVFGGDTAPPPEPRPWPAALAGAFLGLVGGLATLAATLGGLGQIEMLGPWWVPTLFFATLGGGRLGYGQRKLARGDARGFLSWLLAPTLLVVVGMIACGTGAMVAGEAINHAEVAWVPVLAAAGGSVTLAGWSSAQLVSTVLLLATLALLGWTRRSAGSTAFDPWPVGVAVVGGALMWLAEGLVATDRTATLLVYAAVAIAGGLLAVLPDEDEADGHARLLAAVTAALAGASTALAVQIKDLEALLEEAAHSHSFSPAEGVAAAEAYAHALAQVLNPWTLAWVALSVLVGTSILPRGYTAHLRPHLARLPRLAVLLLLLVPTAAWNTLVTRDLVDRLVPAWQAAAVAAQVPQLVVQQQDGRLVASNEAEAPLQPGDLIVAVAGLAVAEPGPLVEHLATLDPDEPVTVTVTRDDRLLALDLLRPPAAEFTD